MIPALFCCSVIAGFLGALLGIGGGILIIPFLTLFLHIDIRFAIAASLISIVATSSGAAASFLRDHLTNLRVAVLLEVGTVFGAITGYLISHKIESRYLFLLFGFFLLFSAAMMLKKREDSLAHQDHPWSKALKLSGSFPNEKGQMVTYPVDHVPLGLILMYVAGILSALLGIGSGILKVLAMDSAMKLPMKVSSATSNFMIGVTATASAGAYFFEGSVRPQIAGPVALGIIVGSFFGAQQMLKIKSKTIRILFIVVLVIASIQMIQKGLT